jgi:iron complex transport system permease protein
VTLRGARARGPSRALPWLLLSVLLVFVVGCALSFGVTRFSWADALVRRDTDPASATILLFVRLPRVLVALSAGASLALAGAALQGLFRNPLAEPGVLGVAPAAALGAVLAIALGWTRLSESALPLLTAGFAAAATAALVALLQRPSMTPTGLLLVGVALGQIASAATALVIAVSLADYSLAAEIMRWLLGGFDGRTWLHAIWGLVTLGVGGSVLWLLAPRLDALSLGALGAESVGISVRGTARWVVLATALLAGGAVATGGVVAFVGLIVPHVIRPWVGGCHARLLPAVALAGAVLLVTCDLVARVVIRPEELPLGVVTACLGAPFLFTLTRRMVEQRA